MFSSLEALDAEDTLNSAPVVRQGVFQPKAKPRVRKGGSAPVRKLSSLPSAPASITGPIQDADFTEAMGDPYVEVARSPITNASECQGRNSPVKVAEVSESPREVLAEAQVAITSLQENPSTDVSGCSQALSGGDDMGSLTTVLHDAPSAFKELLASHAFKPDQSTRKKHEPRRRSHSQMDKEGAPWELAREEPISQQNIHQSDVLEPFTTGIVSHESEVVVPLKYMEHTQNERLDGSSTEVNEEPLVEHGVDARRLETSVETNTEVVMEKDKRDHHQAKKHQENATLDVISNLPKKTTKPKKAKFAIFDESGSACASQAEEIADEGNDFKATTQEAAVGEPLKKKKKRGGNQAKQVSKDAEMVSSNAVNAATLKETKKVKCGAIFAASASQPGAEVANEGNCAVKFVQEALVANAVETAKRKKRAGSEAEEQQDTAENVSSQTVLSSCSRETNKRTRKKPARFVDSADDDVIRAITQDSLEPSEKKKRGDINQGGDDAENDLLITFVQEKTKVKKSKLASFSANTPHLATGVEDGIDKSAPPENEKGKKKKFKKCLPSRRRVERCVINPANPDLDPKKMTMKDIIRLAEAKEKLLKSGNTKKAKDGNGIKNNALEKEDESFESTCLAPQVQIVDGRIVINQESLTVSAHPKADIRTYTRVEETHSKLNYHSYMKRTPKLKWRKDETDLFYEALREFGTNFAMIQHLFPGRTRKQVLLKYKKEEKSCPLRVSEAMRLKPCETSHFMEVMSSMNLLPSEIPATLESDPGVYPFDTTFCRESDQEGENTNYILAGAERRVVDDSSKLEELPMQSRSGEKHENNDRDPWNSEAVTSLKLDDNHIIEEAPKPADDTTKPSESPNKASSVPRKKKSLFSYQTTTIKSGL